MNTVVRGKSINIPESSQIFFVLTNQCSLTGIVKTPQTILRTLSAILLAFRPNKWLNHKDVSVYSQVLEGNRRDTDISHLFKILTER